MAVTPECLEQHQTSAGNHPSQIKNCFAIYQKIPPTSKASICWTLLKKKRERSIKSDYLVTNTGTGTAGTAEQGKEQQEDLQKRM